MHLDKINYLGRFVAGSVRNTGDA